MSLPRDLSARASSGSFPRLRLAALPWGAIGLAAVLGLAFAYWASWATRAGGWSVMTDELQYVKLAIGVDQGSLAPRIYGQFHGTYSQLYPALLAIPYGLFDVAQAYELAHRLNAALMVSAGIPAFLLARHVTRSTLAGVLVAALTVSVPWIVFSSMLLTESAAYPASVWAFYLMQRAVAEPSYGNDALAIFGVLLAFLARTQLVALAAVMGLAVLVFEIGRAGPVAGIRAAVLGHRLLAGVAVLGLIGLGHAAFVGSPSEVLGSYGGTAQGDLTPPGLAQWTGQGVAVVAVAIGVVPLALGLAWALAAVVGRAGDDRHRSFAAIAIVGVTLPAFAATSFAVRFSGAGVHDRYLFYIAPLMFTGMAACLVVRRLPLVAWALAAAIVAYLVQLPEYLRALAPPPFNSPAAVFHSVVYGRSWQVGQWFGIEQLTPSQVLPWLVVAAVAAAALLLPRLSRTVALLGVALPVLLFCVLETRYVFAPTVAGQLTRLAGSPVDVDWVDRAVPEGSTVAMLHSSHMGDGWRTQRLWWDTEFFNRTVNQLYALRYGDEQYSQFTPFPAQSFAVDPQTGAISAPSETPYLLLQDQDYHVRFRPYADTKLVTENGLALLAMDRPYRARWTSDLSGSGWLREDPGHIRVFGPGGAGATVQQVAFTLTATEELKGRRTYRVEAGDRTVRGTLLPGESRSVSLRLCVPRSGHREVTIQSRGLSKLANGEPASLLLWPVNTTPTDTNCRA
jgi:hypothetical protein